MPPVAANPVAKAASNPTAADEQPRQGDALLTDTDLPLALRAIPDAPPRLYCRGDAAALHAPAVAVVGSRRCTAQGREIAFALGRELATQGLCVVSGLAYGIDAAAHRGALQASAGPTVAVLGGGLERLYPRMHAALAAQIVAAGGALVSEHPPRTPPRKHHFPARNRIISGLCLGVVLVEASARSGSLVTARMALEQGREVMAVPSAVSSPLSVGCHRLIREGAALVERAEHVLEALGLPWQDPAPPSETPKAAAEDPVLAQINATVTSLDAIVAAARLPAAQVLERLLELEIDGRIVAHGGGYMRAPV